MPLRNDLLAPIAGENPSGTNLRYQRVYDQIKEARTEDDESIPTGDWQRQPKRADFALVIRLAGDAIAMQSKDLQLLAWLTEAHLKREGITLLPGCLELFLALQQQFWETLYPEVEEGDSGLRAMPVEWMANRVSALLREAPLTNTGLSFYRYKESRTVGYEADASSSDSRREARERAIADGKLSPEEFDSAFRATPKAFYADVDHALDAAKDQLDLLAEFSDQRYGSDGPSFNRLYTAIEEVKQVANALLNEKRKIEPDTAPQAAAEEAPSPEAPLSPEILSTPVAPEPVAAPAPTQAAAPAPAIPARQPAASSLAAPSTWEGAMQQVQLCAGVFTAQEESSPIPYLLQTGLRWGELRSQGSSFDPEFAVPPSTEIRQRLRRLVHEGNWSDLLRAVLTALGEPSGRLWLDPHRLLWKTTQELGYTALASTVLSSLLALLRDFPELPHATFNDDTPVAGAETRRWLEETVLPKPSEPEPAPEPSPALAIATYASDDSLAVSQPEALNSLELARGLFQQGRAHEAIRLLLRDAAQQESGRLRFRRRTELAELCIAAGFNTVALPLLQALAQEIEQRHLETWEATDLLAPPLKLLLASLRQGGEDGALHRQTFAQLCRIDPAAALDCP